MMVPALNTAQATEAADLIPLYLEVYVNGNPAGLIAEFSQDVTTGALSSRQSELVEIGIKLPPGLRGNVPLASLPGVSYAYQEAQQVIALTVELDRLRPAVISARHSRKPMAADNSYGIAINYDAFAGFGEDRPGSGLQLDQLSLTLDSWLFSPFGTLSHYGRLSRDRNGRRRYTRLATTYEYNAQNRATTLLIGDTISSSPVWARSIRMGGIQLRRDFSLRSDLVTEPLLSFGGVASVPSTVDVYIENHRVYSGRTGSGPFVFEDIPVSQRTGDAVIVVRDDNGETITREVSFFQSQHLLKQGVLDYSIEVGRAREGYGQAETGYSEDVLFIGSLRYGLSNQVTLEAHAQGKSDLEMFGLGASYLVADRAELTMAGGASRYRGEKGYFAYAALRTAVLGNNIELSVLRASDDFADLSLATSNDYFDNGGPVRGSLSRFPTRQDVLSASFPLRGGNASLGASYISAERGDERDKILALSYGQSLGWNNASLSAYASRDFEDRSSRFGVNLSFPLGRRGIAQAAHRSAGNGDQRQSLYMSRSLGQAVGDVSYDAEIVRTRQRTDWRASVQARTRFGRGEVALQRIGGRNRGYARFDGALVLAGGHIAAGNRINDGFALVRAGVPNASIYLHNREIARANRAGNALVPGLSSYRPNRLSLNVDELPLEVAPNVTAMEVVPSRRGGVVADFGIREAEQSALVVLKGPTGQPVPAGSIVHLGNREFPVGYDGEAYLEGLSARNRVRVTTQSGACQASFGFTASDAPVTRIESVICQ